MVNNGAAISFMQPDSATDGLTFWRTKIFPEIAAGTRVLFVACLNETPVGTVQLGIARRLMLALEHHAKSLGKTLITLDTRTGDNAERLYASLGFRHAGIIPNYAYDPDGRRTHATTHVFKEL